MDLIELEEILAKMVGTTKEIPFGPQTLVYKVMGKIFAMVAWDEEPVRFNLKCKPAQALELRARFPKSILPGYYMNKDHWNTIVLDGSLPDEMIKEMIDQSYHLVVQGLKKAERGQLNLLMSK